MRPLCLIVQIFQTRNLAIANKTRSASHKTQEPNTFSAFIHDPYVAEIYRSGSCLVDTGLFHLHSAHQRKATLNLIVTTLQYAVHYRHQNWHHSKGRMRFSSSFPL